MRAVIQRVSKAELTIDGERYCKIGRGLVVLIGVEEEDTIEDVEWLARKVIGLRIFGDDNDKMNLSVADIDAECMVVSQFTLHASTKKGNRPSFIKAARPIHAIPLYEAFVENLAVQMSTSVATGEFGANMQVNLTNDGPVTILIDTKNKE